MVPKRRILIVEDELIIAEDLRDTLESMRYEVIGVAYNMQRAINLIEKNHPDIVLLDIMLNGVDMGITIAEEINKKYKIPFIFVSAFSDRNTLERAKTTNPSAYLVKPFQEKSIFAAVELALSKHTYHHSNERLSSEYNKEMVSQSGFWVKDGNEYRNIGFDEVLWLRAVGNYVEIKTHERKFLIRSPLKNIGVQLPENKFIRIHKSYIVFKNLINSIEKTYMVIDGVRLPIGKKYKDFLFRKMGIAGN
jgi:DNA-binding LytR/AlgR family response regulator